MFNYPKKQTGEAEEGSSNGVKEEEPPSVTVDKSKVEASKAKAAKEAVAEAKEEKKAEEAAAPAPAKKSLI